MKQTTIVKQTVVHQPLLMSGVQKANSLQITTSNTSALVTAGMSAEKAARILLEVKSRMDRRYTIDGNGGGYEGL